MHGSQLWSSVRWMLGHQPMHAQLKGSMKELNKLIYFFFPPITQWCSISDVLFIGGRDVSDLSVLKYYKLNINYLVNILERMSTYFNRL